MHLLCVYYTEIQYDSSLDGEFLEEPQVAGGGGQLAELGVVVQVQLLQQRAGADLLRQGLQIVRGLAELCVCVYARTFVWIEEEEKQ